MATVEEILAKAGLKYEDLDKEGYAGEKEYLHSMLEVISKNKLTLENVKEHIVSMRDAVERELTEYPEGKIIKIWFFTIRISKDKDKELMLKARLKNYMLLEAFLSTPEKAKAALERSLAGMVSSRK